ncbi:MAG: hypothetical protein DI539_18970 [Flavobacterium psychrophilum]|nr:MAG: hypothetical protein DI539_18970 [Flavobacterium psychrophilum]
MENNVLFVTTYWTLNQNRKLYSTIVYLKKDDWNDWFEFYTLYNANLYINGQEFSLGYVKIGHRTDSKTVLPETFTELDDSYFSLGQDLSYYEKLNNIGETTRDEILSGLNDICLKVDLYEEVKDLEVTRTSLLRDISRVSVEGQFRRLVQGDATLTSFEFEYIYPKVKDKPQARIQFDVQPNSNPPTNIHVVIGRNGVGKTFLFNNMISTLLNANRRNSRYGYFNFNSPDNENSFANIVSVSFSAFDEFLPVKEDKEGRKIKYTSIGLRKIEDDKFYIKSLNELKDEFVAAVEKCRKGSKNQLWLKALEILETDPIFKAAQVTKIAKIAENKAFVNESKTVFSNLSSGHKIILLSITNLVIHIEEKSLVIIDEPETYLHPPLLSAFIRALSNLLIKRNAVAIIGTHSPVVLQEVPRSCVIKLVRRGSNILTNRLTIESFGENVGILTREVFGLEITEAGFHDILQELSEEKLNYKDALLELNNQLGLEGRAILRNLFT